MLNLDRDGLLVDILRSVIAIYRGRTWMPTEGFEVAGRVSYTEGLDLALSTFSMVQTIASTDLEILIRAEKTFLAQELKHCDESDTQAISSLTHAIQSFDDALLSLEAVEKGNPYQIADMVIPHISKYRVKGMPRDAFHIACISHQTRIKNSLRTPGLNLVEKELLKLRASNLTAAKSEYLKKQREALLNSNNLSK